MANLINPLGSRLGKKFFWQGAYPVVYQRSQQFKYFELTMNLRLLVNILLTRIFGIQPLPKSENHFHGLLVNLLVNVWGAEANRCSVNVRLFDYKVVVLLLDLNVRKHFLSQFVKLMAWNWMVVTDSENASTALKTRIGLPALVAYSGSLYLRVKQFIIRYVSRIGEIMEERIDMWHYAIIVFTRPYLRYLVQKHNFTKFIFNTIVEHGSLSACMLVRYMILKLKQGFDLTSTIKNVRSGILQIAQLGNRIVGYKLCCSGRFTRKQIATYRWVRYGYLCLNQIEAAVDYAQDRGVTKYGAYGIKLWLFYS